MRDGTLADAHCWERTIRRVLDDAIVHLQHLVFDTRWPAIRAAAKSDADALRESLRQYERGLGDIFSVLRASGLAGDGVAWSAFKAEVRRAARDSGEELSLRTARDEALYAAEHGVAPPPDAAGRAWASALQGFMRARAEGRRPTGASEDDRIAWALSRLAGLEESEAFDHAFRAHIAADPTLDAEVRDMVIAVQDTIAGAARFDVIMNVALRWLADCAEPWE